MAKKCSKCGEEKPATKEHYLLRSDTGNFRNECRVCVREYQKKNKKQQEPNTVCDYCGKPIYRSDYQFKKSKHKFCGRSCRNRAYPLKGDKNPSWTGGRLIVECFYCGKPKEQLKCLVGGVKKHFCGKDCYDVWQLGKPATVRCSNFSYKKIKIICDYCGKDFERWPAWVREQKNMYCSKECLKTAFVGRFVMENNPRWLGGVSFESYPLEWQETLREKIRARDYRLCQVCSKTENDNGRKLDVHHIDYNKDNIADENLISLCRVCHIKTNANRDYWQAYFTQKGEVCC